MFNRESRQEHTPVCNLVPGFAFYDEFGNHLAEVIVNFVESISGFIGRFRT